MLRRGVGGEAYTGVHQQRAQAVAHRSCRPSARGVVAQELESVSREDSSSVCVGRQHSSVLFST